MFDQSSLISTQAAVVNFLTTYSLGLDAFAISKKWRFFALVHFSVSSEILLFTAYCGESNW